MGFDYGDFQAHNNLWQHAVDTGHDLMDRMAIVHRVLEARALDVVPRTLEKFRGIGDPETAAVLVEVANDEVGHVSAGSRWFHYRCEQEGVDPDSTFFSLVQHYFGKYPKGPFNTEARSKAGFSANELALLKTYDDERRGKRTSPSKPPPLVGEEQDFSSSPLSSFRTESSGDPESSKCLSWIPAFAGMTIEREKRRRSGCASALPDKACHVAAQRDLPFNQLELTELNSRPPQFR
jgi:hypothetical protein